MDRKMFIEKVDGVCGIKSMKEVAYILGVSENTVFYRMNKNEFFSIPFNGDYLFPAFQFKNGKVIDGLADILYILGDISPEAKCTFFLNPLFSNSDKKISDYLSDYPDSFEAIKLEATFYLRMGG